MLFGPVFVAGRDFIYVDGLGSSCLIMRCKQLSENMSEVCYAVLYG
jgi:hypothetical protein